METASTGGSGEGSASADEVWLDVDSVAEIEITSEDPEHPIDSAIGKEEAGPGWHAANPGEQMIRICFLEPRKINQIRLVFEEDAAARTQEFVLRWAAEQEGERWDIGRKRYEFDPPHVVREVEDYKVKLDGVKVLELSITPSVEDEEAYAKLSELRLR